jgi:hypothetical protein
MFNNYFGALIKRLTQKALVSKMYFPCPIFVSNVEAT